MASQSWIGTGVLWRWSVAVLMLGALPAVSEAKILCVNGATGNDATTYAANNGTDVCWQTIGRAAWGSTNRDTPNSSQAAAAGDVVRIAPGVYTTPGRNAGSDGLGGGARFALTYNPVNTGTSGNPIRFECTTIRGCHLRHTAGTWGPMIGASKEGPTQRNYIHWSGFVLDAQFNVGFCDSGHVLFYGESTSTLQLGGLIENSELIGQTDPSRDGGGVCTSSDPNNYDGVRLEYASGTLVRNNVIRNFGGLPLVQTSRDHNHAGVTTYNSTGITIEQNEISNSGSGVYLKANISTAPSAHTVRYNRIYDVERGVIVHRSPGSAVLPVLIYQNIISDADDEAVQLLAFTGTSVSDPLHVKVINNTFYNCVRSGFEWTGSSSLANAGHVFWNNIVQGGDRSINLGSAAHVAPDRLDAEHNLYNGFLEFALIGVAPTTFDTWKATHGQDTDDGGSADGVSGVNPNFVNAGSGDFHLQAGSPALTLGRVHPTYSIGGAAGATIPSGAYITGSETIGVVADGVPSTVQNLRIVTPP